MQIIVGHMQIAQHRQIEELLRYGAQPIGRQIDGLREGAGQHNTKTIIIRYLIDVVVCNII